MINITDDQHPLTIGLTNDFTGSRHTHPLHLAKLLFPVKVLADFFARWRRFFDLNSQSILGLFHWLNNKFHGRPQEFFQRWTILSRVARCSVFNRTVRYFGFLSNIKMIVGLIPDRIAFPVSTGVLPHSLPEWAFRARHGLWRICLCPKVVWIAEHKFGNR